MAKSLQKPKQIMQDGGKLMIRLSLTFTTMVGTIGPGAGMIHGYGMVDLAGEAGILGVTHTITEIILLPLIMVAVEMFMEEIRY